MPFLNSKLMWSHTMEAACEAPILRIPQMPLKTIRKSSLAA